MNIDALALLPRVEHLRQLLDRREELVEVQHERDHHTTVTVPLDTNAEPAPSTTRGTDVGEEQHEREVDRDETLCFEAAPSTRC